MHLYNLSIRAWIIVTVFLISACSNHTYQHKTTKESVEHTIDGVWLSKGYGYILNIENDQLVGFDITDKYCIKNPIFSLFNRDYFQKHAQIIDSDTIFNDFNGLKLNPIIFKRQQLLPERCHRKVNSSDSKSEGTYSIQENFDVFWSTFIENSVLLNEKDSFSRDELFKNIDITNSKKTTSKDLFNSLDLMLHSIRDGHAMLSSNRHYASYRPRKGVMSRLSSEFDDQDKFKSKDAYIKDIRMRWNTVLSSYIGDSNKNKAPYLGQIQWSVMANNVSYLSLKSMANIVEINNLSQINMAAELAAVDKIMQAAITDFDQSNGLIIDLRKNNGGHDKIALRIVSHLINKSTVIGTKQVRIKNGFSKPFEIIIEPNKAKTYHGPIVVLTSDFTISAAEIFAFALLSRDNVTFVGENTNGSFSDALIKFLPNGWQYRLSNEMYIDTKGNNYEGIGIPVKHEIKFLDKKQIDAGVDLTIEKAISIINRISDTILIAQS